MINIGQILGTVDQLHQRRQQQAWAVEDRSRMEQARQHAGPALLGDQNALSALAGFDPGQAAAISASLATRQEAARRTALDSQQVLGRLAGSLLQLPPEQRAGAYQQITARYGSIPGLNLPAALPDDATLQAVYRSGMTISEQQSEQNNRIVPASFPVPGATGGGYAPGGAAPPPPASGPNVPAQREAVNWLADARREALATLTGPALDARLNEINEQAGRAMGRRAGGSSTAFQGAGPGGQAPAQPAAASAGQAPQLVPLMRGNRPYTDGLQAGWQWGQAPDGSRQAMRIPGMPDPEDTPAARVQAERLRLAQEAAAREAAGTWQEVRRADGIYRVNNRTNEAVRVGDLPANEKPPTFTEGQSASAMYADRVHAANQVLERFPDGVPANDRALRSLPFGETALGNYVVSSRAQQIEQAQREFINAILRRESGAVISDSEFDSARKQYFPQPGEGPEVKAQKAEARRRTIEGLQRASGPAYKRPEDRPRADVPTGDGGPASPAPVRVSSPAEAAALPSGTRFLDPNGVERVVP